MDLAAVQLHVLRDGDTGIVAGGGTGKGGDERAFAAGISADGAVFDRDIVFVGKEAGQIRRGKRL